MDKTLIVKNFSKSAKYYDKYSLIQDLCASKLIRKLDQGSFEKILDIGCGTGNFTRLLRNRFCEAQITAVDISRQMIKVAKEKFSGERIEFARLDGESLKLSEKFDLITSNAAFQWFGNLKRALSRYTELLTSDGMIIFSTFGPGTFKELGESLSKLLGQDAGLASKQFLSAKRVENAMKAVFSKSEIEIEVYRKRYVSLIELLKTIKYTGTRGSAINGSTFWTPGTIEDLEKICRQDFGDIIASYEVIFARGIK